MIISTKALKDICSNILPAVDNSLVDPQQLTTTLELVAIEDHLLMNVTNREYYVQASLPLLVEKDFHTTVNATLFLKLISQMTTPDIELWQEGNALKIKGNGTYSLPLIFDNDNLLELPKIEISNITCEMDVKNEYLQSILKFNSKETKKTLKIKLPVQKMYYMDEEGAITFTLGACVNSFTLDKPIRLILNEKLVKLFKLFDSEYVHLTYGIDALGNSDILQPKLRLSNGMITISAILSNDDNLIRSFPVKNIRKIANTIYPYNIELSKGELLSAINRLILFKSAVNENIYNFTFESNKLTIKDNENQNKEEINYLNETLIETPYNAKLDLADLKVALEAYDEQCFNLCFGNSSNIMTIRGNIKNIIPEVTLVR